MRKNKVFTFLIFMKSYKMLDIPLLLQEAFYYMCFKSNIL